MRRNWLRIFPPYSWSHSQTRSSNASRPISDARRALGDQGLLDHVLRRDAGMVVARLEQRVEALHALRPDDRVAERELQRMAGVELAGHIGRRVRVDIRRARRVGVGVVETLGLPCLLPALLDAVRVVPRLHAQLLPADGVAGRSCARRGDQLPALAAHRADPAELPRAGDGDLVPAAAQVGDHVRAEARLDVQ